MQREKRNQKIQILRGLAIIAVVLIHTCPSGYWQIICRPFINFSVATFLFLSGYLTRTENEDWFSFCKKRITRVIIPYAVWSVLYTIASKSWSVADVLRNLITAKSAATMYYIFVYIQFVLLTPLLGKLAKSKLQWTGWLIAPLSVIIFKYYPLITGNTLHPYLSLFYGDSCLGWFSFYYLGLLLGNNLIQPKYRMKTLAAAYILAIFINIVESYIWFICGETINCGTQIKLSSFLTSSVFILMAYSYISNKNYSWTNNTLIIIGDYSFGIYLSHIMFMRIYSHLPIYPNLPFVINSVVIIITSLSFVHYGSRICNKELCNYLGFK